MRRRARRGGEIPFSFDSFLDVVANVCGIVIRLILVVWVGARSYPSLQKLIATHEPVASEIGDLSSEAATSAELEKEVAQHRSELHEARQKLLEYLSHRDEARKTVVPAEARWSDLTQKRRDLEQAKAALEQKVAKAGDGVETTLPSAEELRQRRQQLTEDVRALQMLPRPRKALYYRTPVSQPVQAEQFMFECQQGRVAFIDLAGLQAEMRRDLVAKGEELKTRWQTDEVTAAIGAFQLRYRVEREPGFADAVAPGAAPAGSAGYRYGIAGWTVEPITAARGEDLATALADGSDFRRITDALDARQAVVTFWVYPDSFELFRRLRDYLYERDLVVAGRPLPSGIPIAASRHGTLSRGQ
jgi:hypothetical protein